MQAMQGRVRHWGARAVGATLVGLLAVTAAAAQTATVQARDGQRAAVREVLIADPQQPALVTAADGAARKVALDQLIAIEWPPRATRSDPAAMTLHLHDGSRLVGRVVGGDEEAVQFEFAGAVTAAFPLDSVRAVAAGPRHAELELARFAPAAHEDALHRRVEVGGDSTRGTVVALRKDGVAFEYSLGVGDFKWEDVEIVLLAEQVEPPPVKGLAVEIDLVPDGTLLAGLLRLDADTLVVRSELAEGEFRLPRAAVSGLRFAHGGATWVSTLPPADVRELPWLGGADDFLFGWRRDRSVTGRPLLVGGRRFGRGIGCHARSELTFALDGAARWFTAEVGIADEVLTLPDRGAVEFRVLLDGREAWKSVVVRGGDPAVALPAIELGDARRLTLLVDFGSGEDVADRAVWGNALLLR
ncbi:MAG: hypothetical protein FJ293_08515 [Planctomycetes bacterium]|nr:hypothetical protein [Planctomycetota bacterium]